jgi:cation transport ATPase
MAKGSGKGDKDEKSAKGKKGKKADKGKKLSKDERVREAIRRSRFSPIKTPVHDADMKEISALRAFLTSLLFFALLLAPVLGLGFYFVWDKAADLFTTRETAFMYGMGAGIIAAFVIAVLFTRKAVATS